MSFFKFKMLATLLALNPVAAISQDFEGLISESYLRGAFEFGTEDTLKYAECEQKTVLTCTYIWGPHSARDASRQEMGLAPEGTKLQVLFVEIPNMQAWQRSTSVYTDPVEIDGLATAAVWSKRRGQLSLMTAENLLIHINLSGVDNVQEDVTEVAQHILAEL